MCQVWCVRYEFKYSITFQAQLSWQGSHRKWMTRKKHVNNDQWKPWYLGVIKFLAIHTKTMEAYTIWWNGGTLRKMLDCNTKYSPIIDNHTLLHQGGPDMEGRA
jgi:hypothetical protein